MLKMIANSEGILITVKVTPASQKPGLRGIYADMLKMSVKAAPEKGKANQEVRELLAEQLGIGKSRIKIVFGETSRQKQVMITQMSPSELRERLGL